MSSRQGPLHELNSWCLYFSHSLTADLIIGSLMQKLHLVDNGLMAQG